MPARAIAATDLSAQILFAYDLPDYAGNKGKRVAAVEITIAFDSTAGSPNSLWPAADLPLTVLFTAGTSNDTLIDVNRPIRSTIGVLHLDNATTAPASTDRVYIAQHTKIASTAAGQLLSIYRSAVASTALLRAADNEDVTGANFFNANPPYKCFMIFVGDRRIGSNT